MWADPAQYCLFAEQELRHGASIAHTLAASEALGPRRKRCVDAGNSSPQADDGGRSGPKRI